MDRGPESWRVKLVVEATGTAIGPRTLRRLGAIARRLGGSLAFASPGRGEGPDELGFTLELRFAADELSAKLESARAAVQPRDP